MSAFTFAALLLPILVVYGALRRSWNGESPPLSRAAAASLAPGFGLGLASCLSFLLLLAHVRQSVMVRVDAALWFAILCALVLDAWRRRPASATGSRTPGVATDRIALAVVTVGALVLLGLAVRAFWVHASLRPHGEWDAWAIWNLRARALVRGAPNWASIFSNQLAWSNVDYPLLMPLTVARLWIYEGAEAPIVPAIVAFTFFASTVATVSVLVGQARGWVSGLLSGAVLVAPHTYVFQASCQCADIPLAQFVLVAIAFGAMTRTAGDHRAHRVPIVLAGAAAGLAAWTKNEGQVLFLLMIGSIATWPRGRRWQSCRWFAAGAAVPVLALLWFKLRLAPDNYLFTAGSIAGLVDRLGDADRWTLIRTQLTDLVPNWGELPGGALLILGVVVTLMASFDRAAVRRCVFGLSVLALTAVGFVFVYAITPLPLEWQILTSSPRLMAQLWPALVWTLFQISTAGVATSTAGLAATVASQASARRLRPVDLAMLGGGTVVVLVVLLTRTWGIHVDEILYFGYAMTAPLGDALIVGNHFLIYVFNYGLYHTLQGVAPSLAPLILPVFYAAATVLAVWWLAVAFRDEADTGHATSGRWRAATSGRAFALLLLSPFVLFNATQLMLETALLALLAGVFASALRLGRHDGPRYMAAVLGGLAALCALTKATALPALALLGVALWPVLGTRVWPLLAGAAAGTIVNHAGLALLHAPSASYGGVGQLIASLRDLSLNRLLDTVGVWTFFAGLPALGAWWSWRQRPDRLAVSLLAAAALSAPVAVVVQLSTDPTLPFPRYAYPVIWVGLAAGGLACARSQRRWLAPALLACQLPLATALWPSVFPTLALWPPIVVREAFQNGGTILSGAPVHGWVAMSAQARERLCVYLPRSSPGALQAEPWFTYVAQDVRFFDASQVDDFRQCTEAKAIFDRRFDVDPCELDACAPGRYRIRSCLPQHIAFYSPRLGDVRTRVCLP